MTEFYYPLDKKILKACAILELKNNTEFVQKFLLDKFFDLNDDSKSIYLALINRHNQVIPVGNYGGLLTALKVYYDLSGINKLFLVEKQLSSRKLIDQHSSKVGIAMFLLGYDVTHYNIPLYYKNIVKRVLDSWNDPKKIIECMETPDNNIVRVMEYCFKGIYYETNNSEIDVYTAILDESQTDKLIQKNKSWLNHETDRTKTIKLSLNQYHNKNTITTDDPRVIMGIALKAKIADREVHFKFPSAISKIYPRFWDVMA